MSILLDFIKASSFKQIPKVARDCFENEEEFVDIWVCKNDAEKTDLIGMCLFEALCMGITTDRELVRYLGLYIVGLQDNYSMKDEEEEEEEVQEVVIPVVQPQNEELQNRIRELEAEVERLKNKPEPKPKVEGRGRGRPPKNSTAGAYQCQLCQICMSSHGALHNHYESKSHTQKVISVLNKSKEYVEKGLYTKIIVKVRSHIDDPKFTKENPDKEYLDNIRDFVDDKINPITDILLVEGKTTETNWVSWKKLC